MPRLITLNLELHDTEIVEDQGYRVGKTRITHPKLDGELFFVHSLKGGSEDFIKALDESVISSIIGVVNVIKDLAANEYTTK